ncbi:MAG: Fe-S protein assembly co-chaperone HscB [SAR324 cluster bacterium]|nr:Fe-S protein assembly co-chaperone HscB [SAR324 cluster bacterium]MCZ6842765.1 Fe-S protein assembly co-chaperone HscB [SAR324 cluster bacterium]
MTAMTTDENYFHLFGLFPSYEIDLEALDAAYERLSLEHHPDFFANAGTEEKARSERMSAELNEGYRVLRSESERSAYLLDLFKAERELDSTQLPDGFLQEMFALQEEVDELAENGNGARAEELKAQAEQRLQAVQAERSALFANVQNGAAAEVLQQIQSNLNCEKYLTRLLGRLA